MIRWAVVVMMVMVWMITCVSNDAYQAEQIHKPYQPVHQSVCGVRYLCLCFVFCLLLVCSIKFSSLVHTFIILQAPLLAFGHRSRRRSVKLRKQRAEEGEYILGMAE